MYDPAGRYRYLQILSNNDHDTVVIQLAVVQSALLGGATAR